MQAPLHEVLSGPRVKGSHLVSWLRHFTRLSTSVKQASLKPLYWHTQI
jgi:hypothetical protein